MKTLALSELRRVAERTRLVPINGRLKMDNGTDGAARAIQARLGMAESRLRKAEPKLSSRQPNCQLSIVNSQLLERVPWRVWYVAASNGDVIAGEECVTLAVDVNGPGAYPSRLVQFTASGQTRRLRDCCILRADDFILVV